MNVTLAMSKFVSKICRQKTLMTTKLTALRSIFDSTGISI